MNGMFAKYSQSAPYNVTSSLLAIEKNCSSSYFDLSDHKPSETYAERVVNLEHVKGGLILGCETRLKRIFAISAVWRRICLNTKQLDTISTNTWIDQWDERSDWNPNEGTKASSSRQRNPQQNCDHVTMIKNLQMQKSIHSQIISRNVRPLMMCIYSQEIQRKRRRYG